MSRNVHTHPSAVNLVALSVELLHEVLPYEAVEHIVTVYHAHTGFAHDTFQHTYGIQVVGSVGIARHIGIAFQQLAIGIIHAAEHHRQVVQQRIAAGHERVSGLIIQHCHKMGTPAGEIINEIRTELLFLIGQQTVAVQEIFAEIAGQAAFCQCLT